jgi:hypothetical protein
MGLGKFFKRLEENKQQMNSLFNDPARRNELIGYDPIKNPLGFLKINPEKFATQFDERRKKLINEATASAVKQQENSRTTFAGRDIQTELERKKLLGNEQGRKRLLGI